MDIREWTGRELSDAGLTPLLATGTIDPRASQLASVETVVRPDGPSLRGVVLR